MAIPGNFLSESTSSMDPAITGWTPKTNCTLLMGTGGRVGDGCLTMKSVAAGEMQCRTVSSYAVVAGNDYEVFADAAGGTVPERIGIRWMTASNVEISVSWSMTTSSASASWHRIAVTATAPTDATMAQVLFSSTPAAGAVSSYLENVYFGLPIRTGGNLLTHGAEGHELATNWPYVAATNCSIARTMPPVSWPTINYVGGGAVATMTVTANGDASFRCTEQALVTPGQEYLASSHLNPPTSGSTAWIELRFYDAAHSQIQATRANLAAPGTNYYMQSVSDVAPPTAVYASVAFGLTGATAGQVLRTDTSAITVAPVLVTDSVVPYSDTSFEAGVGTWTVVSGVATLGRTSPWAPSIDAFYAMTITSSTATTSVIRSGRYPLPDGEVNFRSSLTATVTAGGWTLTRGLRWYDAANASLGLTTGLAGAAPTPGWWKLSNDFVRPVGATQVAFEWTLVATAPSSVLRVDVAAIWPVLPAFEVEPDDATGSVRITLRELNLGDAVSLWRVTPDGRRTHVRGTAGLISGTTVTSSSMVIEDYEAPLGIPVYYYAEMLAPGATLASHRTSDTVTISLADRNECWLKDPGNPQRNLRVLVKQGPNWQRPIAQAEYRVRGRRNSVVLSDVRGGLEGGLALWTRTDEERGALHWLLDSGNVLLWQAMPGMGVSDMYVNVGQVDEARVTSYAPEPWREWQLPLREADMPTTVGVAGSAGRTWQDVLTENATWEDVLNRYATWEDVFLNRPIGG
ncbi:MULTISPECIES: hypothetical protein [Streptomyces]|uniref:Minor tail protein n=1 Tax=Streptomyces venezuelae (strain ATCC 10712 / CBS 650.69 / DSM 40230 / JCM 4526 / NBRC 13096 / PD 04745) TaxID=953739 RepID=F2R0S5_STRVP|nr:hypothetical protein [Streptomyces venezuelae]APE21417.1 hypothetical protein vnz_10530 [Streptomyces venezuelae]QER98805.1 hypothetical protein DEJ43_10675 [Streptomyces venezuelae ATCC 10712]CCA55442.1 hypothetical protein SVEN_2156 [Streptomyces venezuelae ATCC 10712]